MKARNHNANNIKNMKSEVASGIGEYSFLLTGTTGRGRSRACEQHIQEKLNSNQSFLLVDPHSEELQEFISKLEQDV